MTELGFGDWVSIHFGFVVPVLVSAGIAVAHRNVLPKPLLYVLTTASIWIGLQNLVALTLFPAVLYAVTSAIQGVAQHELQLTPPFSWFVRAVLWEYWTLFGIVVLPLLTVFFGAWLAVFIGKRWRKIVESFLTTSATQGSDAETAALSLALWSFYSMLVVALPILVAVAAYCGWQLVATGNLPAVFAIFLPAIFTWSSIVHATDSAMLAGIAALSAQFTVILVPVYAAASLVSWVKRAYIKVRDR